jgi:hypothetical protein
MARSTTNLLRRATQRLAQPPEQGLGASDRVLDTVESTIHSGRHVAKLLAAAYGRAPKIFERVLGTDHPNVATLVYNLGEPAQARAVFQRALAVFERFLPPDHPHIQTVRGNLESL